MSKCENTLSSCLENEKAVLNEIESIIDEAPLGELSDDQAKRIEELEARLYGSKEDIRSKVDAFAFYISELQSQSELNAQWTKNYQSAKKSVEKKIFFLKSYLAKMMEFHQIEGNLKGSVATIKNTSKKEFIIVDKEKLPQDTFDAVFKIPYCEFFSMPESLRNDLLTYFSKYELNESRATSSPIPGVEERYIHTVSIYGMKKSSKEVE